MKGLAILGSPHKAGNNAQLLSEVITEVKENQPKITFEEIWIKDLNLAPCQACGSCEINKGCIINDDMAKIYNKFNQSNLIIIASPLYFNTVSAQIKTLIDRCQALWASKIILEDPLVNADKKRVGGFISTAGQPLTDNRFKYVTGTIDLFFKSINAEYNSNLFVGNIDQEPLTNRTEIIQKAHRWGEKLAEQLPT
ncbi:flavodoxin family protein [Halanaerocella petrolearia]